MPVDAIVAGIETAVQEPSHLAVFEVAVADLTKRMKPRARCRQKASGSAKLSACNLR
jgi:hypothetical protein